MVLRRFKTTTIFEMDSETGRSRIMQHYTQQMGEGVKLSKPKKAKPKEVELKSEAVEEVLW